MEITMYIIKPEGMQCRGKIKEILAQNGLVVMEQKILILPEWTINVLYPELSNDLRVATRTMLNSFIEAGLMCGEQVVEKLFHVAGTETSPANCQPGSIRFIFGGREPIVIGSVKYYANAIHRPKNHVEAKRDVELYHKL